MSSRIEPRTGVRAAKLFVSCWLLYSVHWAPYIIREHFPAIAVAEHGTLNVERFHGWTEDIFRGPNGGVFINNNPGASIAGATALVVARPVLYAIERWNLSHPAPVSPAVIREEKAVALSVEQRQDMLFLAVAFFTVALVMAPASASAAAFLAVRLAQAGVSAPRAAAAALLYAFGTPVFFRTAYLNHNLLVAQAGLIAFLLLYDAARRPVALRSCWFAGMLAGFAVLCDYSGLLLLAAAGLYSVARAEGRGRLRRLALYAAGAAPFLLGLLAYQWTAFGNPFLPSQQYMTAVPLTSQGYRGFGRPDPALLLANFFDPRFGLFVYCPLLGLAFAAPFLRRVPHRLPRRETIFVLAYFGAFVLFCAANRYSWLQPSTGFRYLVSAVPGLLLLSLQALQVFPAWLRFLVAVSTTLHAWAIAMTHQHHA